MKTYNWEGVNPDGYFLDKLEPIPSALPSFQKLFQVSPTALSDKLEPIPSALPSFQKLFQVSATALSDKLEPIPSALPSFQKLFQVSATALSIPRSEERFSRNAETDLVCRLLLEKKKFIHDRLLILQLTEYELRVW